MPTTGGPWWGGFGGPGTGFSDPYWYSELLGPGGHVPDWGVPDWGDPDWWDWSISNLPGPGRADLSRPPGPGGGGAEPFVEQTPEEAAAVGKPWYGDLGKWAEFLRLNGWILGDDGGWHPPPSWTAEGTYKPPEEPEEPEDIALDPKEYEQPEIDPGRFPRPGNIFFPPPPPPGWEPGSGDFSTTVWGKPEDPGEPKEPGTGGGGGPGGTFNWEYPPPFEPPVVIPPGPTVVTEPPPDIPYDPTQTPPPPPSDPGEIPPPPGGGIPLPKPGLLDLMGSLAGFFGGGGDDGFPYMGLPVVGANSALQSLFPLPAMPTAVPQPLGYYLNRR